jgi:hypothetical protein
MFYRMVELRLALAAKSQSLAHPFAEIDNRSWEAELHPRSLGLFGHLGIPDLHLDNQVACRLEPAHP